MLHVYLDTATSARPTGLPTQAKVFQVTRGPYAGRLVALFARTPSQLAITYADPPYTAWLDPSNFITDAADQPFDATIDDDANLYVAHTQVTTEAVRCVKLVFAGGTWAVQTPVTVYDSATSTNRHPSILKDAYARLWVAWTREDSGVFTMRVKPSTDDGQTFGGGAADAGTDLSGATTAAFGLLIARADYIHCLFTLGGTTLKNRDIALDAEVWNAADTLYTGTGLSSDLSAAVSAEGMLGALFAADGQLLFKEYDGAVWGALQTVSAQVASSPSLRYNGTAPFALFLLAVGTNQTRLYESHRVNGQFAAPAPVLTQMATFATVWCHDADAGVPYADRTAEAASATGADVFHPTSNALLAASGDAVYFGSNDRFSFIRILLSTPGAGGTVTWSYWNGAEWMNFVPASGTFMFDAAEAGVRLWTDGFASPADWQKVVVNGANRYWVRAVVATPYTTAPVGSQHTAVPDMQDVIVRHSQT